MRYFAILALLSTAWAAGRDIVLIDTDSDVFGDDGAAVVMLRCSLEQVTVAGVKPAPLSRLTGRRPRSENGVAFLISEIEKRPGEITILAIGPMTNIALALRMKQIGRASCR